MSSDWVFSCWELWEEVQLWRGHKGSYFHCSSFDIIVIITYTYLCPRPPVCHQLIKSLLKLLPKSHKPQSEWAQREYRPNWWTVTSERAKLRALVTSWHRFTLVCLRTVSHVFPSTSPWQSEHAGHVQPSHLWNTFCGNLPGHWGGNLTCCWHTCFQHMHKHISRFFPLVVWLRNKSFTYEGKHQEAGISHGWNIFALTLARDADSPVCTQGPPLHSSVLPQFCHSPADRGPQMCCEVFRFSEALNEDGCSSRMFFSAQSDSQALSPPEHPQESFFFPVYLPTTLLCQRKMTLSVPSQVRRRRRKKKRESNSIWPPVSVETVTQICYLQSGYCLWFKGPGHEAGASLFI